MDALVSFRVTSSGEYFHLGLARTLFSFPASSTEFGPGL
jgi:hypothetical protein